MTTFRNALLHALLVGSVACGGSTFTPEEGAGTTGAGGASATGTSGSTSGSSSATTSGTTTTGTTGTSATTVGTTSGSTTSGGGGAAVTTSTTTGSAGSGGASAGAGGSSGTGGRADAGPDGSGGHRDASTDAPVSCDAGPPSAVTFRMRAEGGADYCINNCLNVWVTIFEEGSSQPLAVTRSCMASCSTCEPIACPAIACIAPQHIKPEGETYTWDGTLWAKSTCGPQMLACTDKTCGTPKGKYVARMCANKSTSDAGPFCTSAPTATCVDVPFEYPTSAVVEGVLK